MRAGIPWLVAGLLAVAVFSLVLTTVFDASLERRMETGRVPAAVRERVERAKLAAIDVGDRGVKAAVREAFVDGYRVVVWMAALLAVASAVSAGVMIERGSPTR